MRPASWKQVDERAQAIETLYRERYGRFRNAIATITGDYDSAHDVVQETFARALRSRRSYRGDGSLEAWVWRIALRTAREQLRKVRGASLNGSLPAELIEAERDPVLAEALRTLPPKRRLIVFLRYFADLSYARIAELCGVSEGTVGATLAQAHAALEEQLQEEGSRERR
jgi:RNA polymerase sigma-70 factor (ECF subfamily)